MNLECVRRLLNPGRLAMTCNILVEGQALSSGYNYTGGLEYGAIKGIINIYIEKVFQIYPKKLLT